MKRFWLRMGVVSGWLLSLAIVGLACYMYGVYHGTENDKLIQTINTLQQQNRELTRTP